MPLKCEMQLKCVPTNPRNAGTRPHGLVARSFSRLEKRGEKKKKGAREAQGRGGASSPWATAFRRSCTPVQVPVPPQRGLKSASGIRVRADCPRPRALADEEALRGGNAHKLHRVGAEKIWIAGAPAVKGVKQKEELKKLGVTHILNMIGDGIYDVEWMGGRAQCHWPQDFQYKILSTNDTPDQSLIGLFKDTSAFIEEGAAAGGVLVQCYVGRSRSVTAVIAFLIDHRGMNTDDALALIRKTRPEAKPNEGFMGQLQMYEVQTRRHINWLQSQAQGHAPLSPGAHKHAHTHTHTNMHMHMHKNMHARMHTHAYTCTQTHTHTHIQLLTSPLSRSLALCLSLSRSLSLSLSTCAGIGLQFY